MKEILLTKEERIIISTIASDNESGGHLLNKRSEEYWELRKKISSLLNLPKILPSQYLKERLDIFNKNTKLYGIEKAEQILRKEYEMLEYYKQCSDYDYYISLSEESRMF